MMSGQAAHALVAEAETNCAWCAVDGALDEAGFCEECRIGVIGVAPQGGDADELLQGVQWNVESFPVERRTKRDDRP